MKRLLLGLALAALVGGAAYTQTVASVRLADTIDKGVGDVDLTREISPAALESFRVANGGRLVFGVDINEAANGTEKASSQAVAVSDAWLELRMADGSTRVYGHAGGFWTETQALVAPAGQTVRQSYYTLLGESGSSRITGGNAIQDSFDSTLKIAVPEDIGGAVSAVLRIRLLDANVKLGDPEAFYDFTAGFEDLAVLSPQDAAYLDNVLPTESTFRTEAPAMELSPQGEATQAQLQQPPAPPPLGWLQLPASGSHRLVAYEDLAPARGDYDFNDVVVAYHLQLGVNADGLVERIEGTAYLVARGSTYRHDWTLDLPLPTGATGQGSCRTVTVAGVDQPCAIDAGGGRVRWAAFQDTVQAFPAAGDVPASPVNTVAGASLQTGPKATFSVTLDTPVPVPAADAIDPWLLVRTTGRTVRLSDRGIDGYPHALALPDAWRVPVERRDMGLAYPDMVLWVGSSGAQAADWAARPAAGLTLDWTATRWAW